MFLGYHIYIVIHATLVNIHKCYTRSYHKSGSFVIYALFDKSKKCTWHRKKNCINKKTEIFKLNKITDVNIC